MVRKIEFRAWDATQNKMIYFGIFDTDGSWHPEVKDRLLSDLPLMQYTGLIDKNGVDIYEGDILYPRMSYMYKKNGELKASEKQIKPWAVHVVEYGLFTDYAGGYEFESGRFYGWNINPDDLNELEIIGNIYENPELLEGGDGALV